MIEIITLIALVGLSVVAIALSMAYGYQYKEYRNNKKLRGNKNVKK